MTGKKPFSRPSPPVINVNVPKQGATIPDLFTASGTFRYEDMILNKEGLKLVSKANEEAAASPAADVQFTLADLETIKVIGKGSGGLVQLVRHKWTNEIYALKVIRMNIQETARRQIVQELKINKATECPYVVVCHHAFYQNGAISILLEYMDGGSLADIVKHNQVPEPHLSVISRQVLQGLHYLHHSKRIIHRDIKPSNLLLNHKSEAKITDFGVSVIVEHSMAERDSFIGTYTYMSPERISGSTYSYDSDIWSLGLTLLECALGRFPYRDCLNFYELLEAIVEQPPPVPPSDQFSPEFCSFISGCLQKNPKHRLSITQLLDHPFIKKYENEQISLSELIPVASSTPE